jgi:hypothetical protein
MVFPIQVGNLSREFAVWFPKGWEYWVTQMPEGRGLPLLVGCHGGGQDPSTFLGYLPFVALQ